MDPEEVKTLRQRFVEKFPDNPPDQEWAVVREQILAMIDQYEKEQDQAIGVAVEGLWQERTLDLEELVEHLECHIMEPHPSLNNDYARGNNDAVLFCINLTENRLRQLADQRFDEASNHPYGCKCKLCEEWHEQVGPEE